MSLQPNGKKLSLESCYEYIDEYVFSLSTKPIPESCRDWPGYVGMEIEMFPVSLEPNTSYPPLLTSPNPIPAALEKLARKEGWEPLFEKNAAGDSVILMVKIKNGENISFEPGGQVEYSSQPFLCLDAAQARLLEMQGILEKALHAENISLLQSSVQPWHSVSEIGILTPKKRYLAMDQYFERIGSRTGRQMMRRTCSIQVCLDFGRSEDVMVKRYLVAQLLAPVVAGMFAYSPYVEKTRSEFQSLRTSIWRELDPARTGFSNLQNIQKKWDRASCIESYLDFALSCPVVFVEALGYFVPSQSITMKAWIEQGINGIYPTLHDFIVHLSLLFPEVRPRAYMELRSVDCQARTWQMTPAAFYVGLLYDSQNLENVLNLLLPTLADLNQNMLHARFGLQSPFLSKLAKTLTGLALEGLGRIPKNFCGEQVRRSLSVFYERFTEQGRTPASDLIDRVQKSGRACPTLQDFRSLEAEWQSLMV